MVKMKYSHFLKYLAVDPVNFSVKAKLLSLMACIASIYLVALITKEVFPWEGHPVIIASMGASAIILFFIPSSPLAQPWPFVGGQLISAAVGVAASLHVQDIPTAATVAVGGSLLLMLLMRCLHPPGAATSLAPIMAGSSISSLGYSFVIVPVAINVIIMLFMAVAINRWLLKRDYPSPLAVTNDPGKRTVKEVRGDAIFSEEDLSEALADSDTLIDITHAELSALLARVGHLAFKRTKGKVLCADIMVVDLKTVEYGTEVEDAWNLLCTGEQESLPVVNKANFVIGIITKKDFFKFIDVSAYNSIQEKIRAFIRRTAAVTATKPESVGQIMTEVVDTCSENAHISNLVSLMSVQGHKQVPIVNEEGRLVGMVYHESLISALYSEGLLK